MKRSLTEYTDDSNSSGSERNTRQKISLDGSFETNTTSSSPNTSPTSPGYNASPYRVRTPSTPQRRILTPRRYLGSSKITDYQLQQKLGEGTFGEVHQGVSKKDGRVVALKRIFMPNEKEGMPITAIREIKILKQLNHRNIVPLIDLAVEKVVENGQVKRQAVYMVFPYMDHDLAGLLDNPSVKLSLPQIKTYMQQLLEGTAYLHHNKIMHRDIKAANLLINNEGILQIADFGLARGVEEENREYTHNVVTRWYRPPELLLGELRYSTAIDIWGIGCIFGELIKGRPIFQGSDDLDQLKKIFRLCGSPTEESMPGYKDLPDASKVHFDDNPRIVKEEFLSFDSQGADLIDKLLTLDPKKRISAFDALQHDFFYTLPPPALPSELPKYESSHESDRYRHRTHK